MQILADMTEYLDAKEMEDLSVRYINVGTESLLHSLRMYKDSRIIDSTLVGISVALCEEHLHGMSNPFYTIRYILDIPYIIRFAN